ncbi:hypothetical protein MAP00_008335 [Monascus purpureus]|nr:hypothetical protein MAP00_008335 [Monascus purpureus]
MLSGLNTNYCLPSHDFSWHFDASFLYDFTAWFDHISFPRCYLPFNMSLLSWLYIEVIFPVLTACQNPRLAMDPAEHASYSASGWFFIYLVRSLACSEFAHFKYRF